MKIKFNITKEDYLKFNMYHLENSKGAKKELIIHRIVIPVLIIGAGFAFHVLTNKPLEALIPLFILIAVSWGIFYPMYYKKTAMKNMDKILSRGVQSSSISKHIISLEEEGIMITSPAGRAINKWGDIIRLNETSEYIFIYVSEKVAHVIPKRAFKDKDEEAEFIGIVNKNIL